jgi:hypothetical protein
LNPRPWVPEAILCSYRNVPEDIKVTDSMQQSPSLEAHSFSAIQIAR